MGVQTRFQGYISPVYPVRLFDPTTGKPEDLTNVPLDAYTLRLRSRATGIVFIGSGTWSYFSDETQAYGGVIYHWGSSDLDVSGEYDAYVTVQFPGEPSPRAYQPDIIVILSFPGVVIVSTQDVNLTQVNGSAVSGSNPVPASVADGADVATGSTSATAYAGSGSASVISLLKGAYTVLASILAKLSIMVSTPGYVSAYTGNGGTATASTEYTFKWGASGNTTVNRWIIQNNSAADIKFELDSAVGAGSIVLPSKQAYTDYNLPISSIHILTSADTPVNGASGNNIVIRGWV